MSRRIVIDPVTRIEGHGKVVVTLDKDHRVADARLHVVEFRVTGCVCVCVCVCV